MREGYVLQVCSLSCARTPTVQDECRIRDASYQTIQFDVEQRNRLSMTAPRMIQDTPDIRSPWEESESRFRVWILIGRYHPGPVSVPPTLRRDGDL